ncbi:MAG TPA: hypothetical protein VGC87_11915 [Pyrinomonadaceae bacterium]|jgi:hypothetical protein
MYGLRAAQTNLVRLAAAGCLLAIVCGLFGGRLNPLFAQRKVKEPPARASETSIRPQTRRPSLSRLPPDVVRDYSYNAAHLLNGAGAPLYAADERYKTFLAKLRQFPPDILIVGKEAPLTHSLGPTLSFGGENRTFPPPPGRKGEDARRLLSPDELRLRIKATEQFVRDVHAAGVKTVIPYISPMTMLGNAERRQGFFQFFDSWEKYAREFDLPERPPGDPLDWTQRDQKGATYFRVGGGREDAEGLTRYSMCVNNPGWRRWQMLVADWIARVGYDGVWMDNVLVHRCYDKYCQAVAKEMGADLSREQDRVWLESYSRYFDDLRRAGGSRRRGEFFLGGNYIELPFQRAVTDDLDLCMVEQVWLGAARILWPGGVWTGYYPPLPSQQVVNNRTRGTSESRSLNNLWVARLAYAMRGERGIHLLAGAPAGKGPEFAHNEDSATLALAEGAAFGGGVAVQVVGQYPFHSGNDAGAHKARERFFTFGRAHRELYERLLPAGDVAIVVFPDQEAAGLVEAEQVHEALLWRGLLVDVLDGDKQSAASLARYGLVIVPGRPALPPWMKALPLLQSLDPLSPEEVREVKKSYQKSRELPQLRRTKLSDLAIERAGALPALTLPQKSLVEGCAWADDRRVVLHLLNFRTPIGLTNGGTVEAVGDVAVRLKLPQGKSVREVRTYSTDGREAKAVAFRQSGNTLSFKVSSVRVYEVCEIIFR